jgi:hypothetical protein
MRAYHLRKAVSLYRVTTFLLLSGGAGVTSVVHAQTTTAAVPSAVVGDVKYCPKRISHDTAIVGCRLIDASPTDKTLTSDAVVVLNKLLSSPQFKAAVMAAHFDPAQMKKCANVNSCGPQLTKEQVYEMILASSPQKLGVTYYLHGTFSQGNQGFDLAGINTAFVNDEKVHGDKGYLASLMLHEWMHILGFRHDSQHTWCESVPYQMNAVYAQVAKSAPKLNLPPLAFGCSDR